MKHLFLIFLLLFSMTVTAQYKTDGCCVTQTTPGSNDMIWENDSIKFTFQPWIYDWKVTIENKTDSNVICLWDETVFVYGKKSSQIIFENTRVIDLNSPKGESVIASRTEISKSILPIEKVHDGIKYEIFLRRDIKKNGDLPIRLIFPISTGESKKIYEFTFNVSFCD